MPGKSDFLETKLLDHELGGPDYVRPTTIYFALFTVSPTDAGGGTELSGGGYARAVYANTTVNWPAAVAANPSTKQNGNNIAFPQATADQNGITAWGYYDAPTGGNLMRFGSFTTTQGVSNGQTPSWGPAGVTATED